MLLDRVRAGPSEGFRVMKEALWMPGPTSGSGGSFVFWHVGEVGDMGRDREKQQARCCSPADYETCHQNSIYSILTFHSGTEIGPISVRKNP